MAGYRFGRSEATAAAVCELDLPGDVRLRIFAGFDERHVRRVLAIVRAEVIG